MTLAQWCNETRTSPANAPNGRDTVRLEAALSSPRFSVLFNLEDYRVAGRDGSEVTLTPTKLS